MKNIVQIRRTLEPPTSAELFQFCEQPAGDFSSIQLPSPFAENAPLTCGARPQQVAYLPEVEAIFKQPPYGAEKIVVAGDLCAAAVRLYCCASAKEWKNVSQTPASYDACRSIGATWSPRVVVLCPQTMSGQTEMLSIAKHWWRAADGSGVLVRPVCSGFSKGERYNFLRLGTDVMLCNAGAFKAFMEAGDALLAAQIATIVIESAEYFTGAELITFEEATACTFQNQPLRIVALTQHSNGRSQLFKSASAFVNRVGFDALPHVFSEKVLVAMPADDRRRVDIARAILQRISRRNTACYVFAHSKKAVEFAQGTLTGLGEQVPAEEALAERIVDRYLPDKKNRTASVLMPQDTGAEGWIKILSDQDLGDASIDSKGTRDAIAVHIDLPASETGWVKRLAYAKVHILLVGEQEPAARLLELTALLYRAQGGRIQRWLADKVEQLQPAQKEEEGGDDWMTEAARIF